MWYTKRVFEGNKKNEKIMEARRKERGKKKWDKKRRSLKEGNGRKCVTAEIYEKIEDAKRQQ